MGDPGSRIPTNYDPDSVSSYVLVGKARFFHRRPDVERLRVLRGLETRPGRGFDLTALIFVNNVFDRHAQLESLCAGNLASTAIDESSSNQPLTADVDLAYRY